MHTGARLRPLQVPCVHHAPRFTRPGSLPNAPKTPSIPPHRRLLALSLPLSTSPIQTPLKRRPNTLQTRISKAFASKCRPWAQKKPSEGPKRKAHVKQTSSLWTIRFALTYPYSPIYQPLKQSPFGQSVLRAPQTMKKDVFRQRSLSERHRFTRCPTWASVEKFDFSFAQVGQVPKC